MNDTDTITADELTDVAAKLADDADAEENPFIERPVDDRTEVQREIDEEIEASVVSSRPPDHQPPVEALAGALANQAEQFSNVAAEQRQEGIEPVFEDGPYDPKQALAHLFELEDRVEALQGDYDVKAKIAKAAKDALENGRDTLDASLRRYRDRSRGVVTEQPPLKTLDPAESLAARDAALQTLAHKLLGRQCFIAVADLAKLSDEDRGQLHAWVTDKRKGPIFPSVLATAHVAGEPGADQCCSKCGLIFPRAFDAYYVAKSLIGLDCPGANLEESRPTAKRGSKKRVDPDAERRAQRADGAKRARGKKAKP